MIGQPLSWMEAFGLLRDPVGSEKRGLLAERWTTLPEGQRSLTQGFGRKATGCGATLGIQPRCDFACSGCYLGEEANAIPALPLADAKAQLEALRAHLGPKGNVQITDGEVTLMPEEDLVALVRHARSLGLIPMVMTHGDAFRRKPRLLPRLMAEAHLRDVSIHIDTTQRGRLGYPRPASELDLMPLRDEFAALIRDAVKGTGLPLRAATTLTLTGENLDGVAPVTRWLIRNRDAFRMISFQPVAAVGRTRGGLRSVRPEDLWAEVAKATAGWGFDPGAGEALHFGHSACTRVVPLVLASSPGGRERAFPVCRRDDRDRAVLAAFMEAGLGGLTFRDDRLPERLARGLGAFMANPRFVLGHAVPWFMARVREELGLSFPRFLGEFGSGRLALDTVTLTSHHFMDPAELATPLGQERVRACVFKAPTGGALVSMCELNAGGGRAASYAGQRIRRAGAATP